MKKLFLSAIFLLPVLGGLHGSSIAAPPTSQLLDFNLTFNSPNGAIDLDDVWVSVELPNGTKFTSDYVEHLSAMHVNSYPEGVPLSTKIFYVGNIVTSGLVDGSEAIVTVVLGKEGGQEYTAKVKIKKTGAAQYSLMGTNRFPWLPTPDPILPPIPD